jgi:hypothetical protein
MISSRSRAGALNRPRRGKKPIVLRRLWVWAFIGTAAVLGAVTIAIVAGEDHDRKTRRIARASVAEWYCAHRGVRCDEQSSASVEESWVRRERAYKAGFAVCIVVACGSAVVLILRRRR